MNKKPGRISQQLMVLNRLLSPTVRTDLRLKQNIGALDLFFTLPGIDSVLTEAICGT